MFVAGNFVLAFTTVLNLVLEAYLWIVVARALLSWVSPDPFNPIVRFLYRVTEPVLRPIRRRLSTIQMGLDISPLIVIVVIKFLQIFLVESLRDLALSLR
jgi:YggT family protein